MDGFDISVAEAVLAGYLLAAAHVAGFVVIAPPFNSRGIATQARVGVTLAMALPLTTLTIPGAPAFDSTEMLGRIVVQLMSGVVLGAFVLLAVTAIETVGDIIDVVGGFTLSQAMDPLLLVQTSVMGRIHQLVAVTLLFVGNGYLIIIQGLSRSMQLQPTPKLNLSGVLDVLTSDISTMFLAAVQITAPIIGALLIADVALGLLTRAAPALNAFSLAFPLKILLSLTLVGLVLTQIPSALDRLIDQASQMMLQLVGG